jgi:hypothetical protein
MMSAGAVVAIGLTLAACLVAILLVVILRWKRRLQQSSPAAGKAETQQEMEWDNSALNITNNPLDVENGFEDDDIELGDHFELSTHDDQNDVIDDLECELAADDLDKPTTTSDKTECKELEWDDSTLSF